MAGISTLYCSHTLMYANGHPIHLNHDFVHFFRKTRVHFWPCSAKHPVSRYLPKCMVPAKRRCGAAQCGWCVRQRRERAVKPVPAFACFRRVQNWRKPKSVHKSRLPRGRAGPAQRSTSFVRNQVSRSKPPEPARPFTQQPLPLWMRCDVSAGADNVLSLNSFAIQNIT